jgi:hypothetical protein
MWKVRDSDLSGVTDHPEILAVFLSLFMKMPGQNLKLGHGRFLPYPFQFIIH